MNSSEIWSIASAVLLSLGGGAGIVLACSSWLGKVWADRMLEQEKSKLQHQLATYQLQLNQALHKHNVAASRIDTQRVDAIRELYGALIGWHEAAIQIVAPNDFSSKPDEFIPALIEKYAAWAKELRGRSEDLEQVAMRTAIFFSEETYGLIAKCGYTSSMMSVEFYGSTLKDNEPGTKAHLERVEEARTTLTKMYSTTFEPTRRAVVSEFRKLVDPVAKTEL
jgi:hypothetical protein